MSKYSPRRIAIFRALQIGDFLVAVPALRAIRAGFPDAEISFIGLPKVRSLAQRFSHYIDRFVEFAGFPGITEVETEPERTAAFVEEQRAYGYDLVIQMHGSGRTSNAFALALKGKITVGYYEEVSPEGLTLGAPYPDDRPEILRNLGLAKMLNCPDCGTTMEFPLSNKDRAEAARLLRRLARADRPWIGLHAGARPPARRWPVEYFASVADDLAERFHAQIILTGGSGEEAIVQEVVECMRTQPLTIAGETSLGGLAALISELDLFISNDTGPANIAYAVDTPSVTLIGPSDYWRWAALDSARHPFIRWPGKCSCPCDCWECPQKLPCLHRIRPEMVIEVAGHLLSKRTVEYSRIGGNHSVM